MVMMVMLLMTRLEAIEDIQHVIMVNVWSAVDILIDMILNN
jgi:hypothetical protein